jgi:hypothetical protein
LWSVEFEAVDEESWNLEGEDFVQTTAAYFGKSVRQCEHLPGSSE